MRPPRLPIGGAPDLLYRRQLGGNPSELFLSDRPLFLNTLLWMAVILLLIYGPDVLRPPE